MPRDFMRLAPLDFLPDGVHLHPLHYTTVRAAVEEEVCASALLPAPPLPRLIVSVKTPDEGRETSSETDRGFARMSINGN